MGEITPHSTQQLVRRQTFDLDIESTHVRPASFRARLLNIDDALEGIMGIRDPGGERLPAPSYPLHWHLKKVLFFPIGAASRIFSTHHTQAMRRYTFDPIESTHGQPTSCRARPVSIDDGLEAISCGSVF
ncbi:unnamed protein product [Laminaria digitata]